MVSYNDDPYLVFNNQLFLWTPFGYAKRIAFPHAEKIIVLTPRSIVNTFRIGYFPQITVP